MAIQVTDTTLLIRVTFKQDSDPDFNGALVVQASAWNGLTLLQQRALMLAQYNQWADARAVESPSASRQLEIDLEELKRILALKTELEARIAGAVSG